MTFFLGTKGNIKLRRGSKAGLGFVQDQIISADVNTTLNRLGFATSIDNLLTGDRVDISTDDPRGLACFPGNTWVTGTVNSSIGAYVNVNAIGGLRFFRSFEDAINNERSNEIPLTTFSGGPIAIKFGVRDLRSNILGNVSGFEFNTDRDTIDTTTLSDKFKQQYTAGLISAAGRIDCAFDYESTGVNETPLLALQLIQRLDIGGEFSLALYLTDKDVDPNVTTVFYDMNALVTRAGVQVRAGSIIECAIDFVTTGEVRLLIGKPADYILKEDDDRLELEQSLDYLLQELDD